VSKIFNHKKRDITNANICRDSGWPVEYDHINLIRLSIAISFLSADAILRALVAE